MRSLSVVAGGILGTLARWGIESAFPVVPPAFPWATLIVNVKRFSTNQNGATVKVLGGPMGVDLTGTTNSSGNATFSNVPVGAGYTIKAWKCSAASPRRSRQVSSITKTSSTQTVNVAFDTSNICPLP